MKKTLLSFMCLFFINACQTNSSITQNYTPERFSNIPPIEFDASKIEVISEFSPTFRRPNVEHLLPVSIEKAATTWAQDRLVAKNPLSDNEVILTIKTASVVEELIPSKKLLHKDSLKYKASLNVELKVKNTNNFSSAQTQIQAWRELTISYDLPIQEKENYWNNMVKKLITDVNTQMQKNINEYLSQYVIK